MVTIAAITSKQAELLRGVLRHSQNGAAPEVCRYRGCQEVGRFFLQRVLKGGATQRGLYCEEHDEQFGEQNLRRWAREVNGRVLTFRDEEGEFRGVIQGNGHHA